MRLRSLTLRRFKKFTNPVCLDGIGDGLNVVVGPNEMGKSTLLDALRAALFERYSSHAEPIEALQNDRDPAGPEVVLAFENSDGLYQIEKRFVKKPYARLTCPGGRQLDDDEAEDALQHLLDFSPAGRTGAKPETLGMWSVLWVQQGNSFGALDLPVAARASLQEALKHEVGDVLGGAHGRELIDAIAGDLGEFVTASGNPRGDYKRALAHIETLKGEAASLERRRQDLTQTVDELSDKREKLAELESGNRDQADRDEIAAARIRRNELAELEGRIQAARSEADARERAVKDARQVTHEREKLREAEKSAKQAAERESMMLKDAIRARAQARETLNALRKTAEQAEETGKTAARTAERNRRVLAIVDRASELHELEDRCAKARDAEQRGKDARLAAGEILVTDDALDQIRTTSRECATLDARLDAQAATVTFEMEPAARLGIEVNGRPLAPDALVLRVVETMQIAIPGRGGITIAPARKNRGSLTARRGDARSRLEAALRAARAVDPEDAERLHDERTKLTTEAKLADEKLALYAPATKERKAGAAALTEVIEARRRTLTNEREDLQVAEVPARQEGEAALNAAEANSANAREAARIAWAKLAGPEETLRACEAAFGAAEERERHARSERERLSAAHGEAEAVTPASALEQVSNAASARLSEQRVLLSTLEAKRGDETLAQLDARIERLGKAIEERQKKRATLRVDIATLTSRLETSAEAGLDEELAKKQREIELCERDCKAIAREVETLGLLLSTLQQAERQAKERYLLPVLKRVQPYLNAMLPSARLTIDENLRLTGLIREADHEEDFSRLSMGTQEQITVLVRLAFAEMLAEQGHPASVVLDDALVFSDDHRMKLMFDILNMASHRVQILILTCRERLFEGLGARQLSLQSARNEELGSI